VTNGNDNAAYSYLANLLLVSQSTLNSNATKRLTVTNNYDYLKRLERISLQTPNSAKD